MTVWCLHFLIHQNAARNAQTGGFGQPRVWVYTRAHEKNVFIQDIAVGQPNLLYVCLSDDLFS